MIACRVHHQLTVRQILPHHQASLQLRDHHQKKNTNGGISTKRPMKKSIHVRDLFGIFTVSDTSPKTTMTAYCSIKSEAELYVHF